MRPFALFVVCLLIGSAPGISQSRRSTRGTRTTQGATDSKAGNLLATFEGTYKELSKKSLSITTAEDNVVEFDLNHKTQFFDGDKEIKPAALKSGDHLLVEAKQNLLGRLEAVHVRLQHEKPASSQPQ